MLFPSKYNSRTQDLKKTYHDAGQFYWGRPEAWLKLKPIFNQLSTIINISRWRAQDIDTLEDWKQAEIIYKSLMKKKYD
jgi:N-acylneuraminate cytidylyltransferase